VGKARGPFREFEGKREPTRGKGGDQHQKKAKESELYRFFRLPQQNLLSERNDYRPDRTILQHIWPDDRAERPTKEKNRLTTTQIVRRRSKF
jgi:hypothetical protein